MRRLIMFAIVALIGFAPLGIRSVSAQTWENNAWQGVTVEKPIPFNGVSPAEPFQLLAEFLGDPKENSKENQAPSTPSVGARLDEAYPVTFINDENAEHYAFIPEVQSAEFMVVIVRTGEFIIDIKGPGSFLVDPVVGPGLTSKDIDKIRIMHGEISGTEIEYTP